ncbi:MAG: helix-turn-helix transcriptional regulator [Sedimentibacter sp.]|uniref:response regulator transcription factor n=1 Tax=Sedimentibacter sp. TaxID=1960295 RepID=UPI0031588CAC
MVSKISKYLFSSIDDRNLSVVVFALLFSWLLAFPFEGQSLYALAAEYDFNPHNMMFASVIFHFLGLLSSGMFVSSLKGVKTTMVVTVLFCMAGSFVLLFPPSAFWAVFLAVSSFLMGCCVSAWSYYFKKYTPRNMRMITAADSLIYSNLLMIAINVTSIKISVYAGIFISVAILGIGVFFISNLKVEESKSACVSDGYKSQENSSLEKPLGLLCIFIVVITVNSGLMYRVINPAFSNFEWLTSWYWAIPYIAAIYIMKNVPGSINRSYILIVGIAMIGFAFIAFMTFGNTLINYLTVDTLILGAFGVYDLFWWSILGEMLEFHDNPSKIMGAGLSANVLGVLLGGVLGNLLIKTSSVKSNTSIAALVIIFIILIILPVLHKQLLMLLKNHAFLTIISDMTQEQRLSAKRNVTVIGNLTDRESEIVELLLKGRTYKMVAEELFLSENTVKTHIKNIYSKLNINSKAELIKLLADEYADR